MVTAESLELEIKRLEAQLTDLKAQLTRLRAENGQIKSFGDLYGILADGRDLTEEEIDAVLYQYEEVEKEYLEALE